MEALHKSKIQISSNTTKQIPACGRQGKSSFGSRGSFRTEGQYCQCSSAFGDPDLADPSTSLGILCFSPEDFRIEGSLSKEICHYSSSGVRALLCLLLLCFPAGVCLGESYDLYTNTVELSGDGRTGPYRLPHPFLLIGREEVWLDGLRLERGEDYSIEYTRGEITFQKKVEAGSGLKVSYWFFPFPIEESYQSEKPILWQNEEALETRAVEEPRAPLPKVEQGELTMVGSRSLGMSFGSGEDPSFDQSLRVNIKGRVSRDVSLKAALSDEGSPLLPEGKTERLSELDKVFVQASGRNWAATLGDCDLSLPGSDFGQVERKLEGAVIRGEDHWGEVTLAGARAEGEFATCRLLGVEGKQGPYELKPEEATGEIVIVPGSERVYLDGEPLTRGESNDYTIDYSAGEVTFTHRRLITRDSRILADFEYSTNSYNRSLFSTSTGLEFLDGRLRLGGMAFREGDESDSPLGFNLTPERREILARAGDDTSAAWVDGGVRVGEGEGSYVLEDSIYEYVGYGKGDYQVSFTKVEVGNYDFDPLTGGYRWVGDGEGDYIPKVRIPFPSRLSLLGLSGEGELLRGLNFKGEYAGTLEDPNAFSPGSGEWGVGRKVSLSLNRWEKVSLKASNSLLQEGFRFPGRFHSVEYEERWESKPRGGETLTEIEGRLTPLSFLEVGADYGELEREDGRSLNRRINTRIGHDFPYVLLGYDRLATSGSESVRKSGRRVSGEHRFGRFQPGAILHQETCTSSPDSGRSYSEVGGAIKLMELGALSGYLGSEYRRDEVLSSAEGWVFESRTYTERLGLSVPKWRGASLNLDLSHRKRKFGSGVPGEDMVFDLASLKGSYYPARDFVSSETSYEISNEERTLKEEQFYEVDEGEGTYSKDPNTGAYYWDENGNYRRMVISVGEPRPITRLAAFLRTRLSPIPLLSLEGTGSVSEETRESNKRAIYLLDLSKFQRDETTIFGKNSLEVEAYVYPEERVTIGGRWGRVREADNRINLRHLKRNKSRSSLHLKTSLTDQVGLDLEAYQEREVLSSTQNGEEKGETGKGGGSTVSFRPVSSVELSLGVGGEKRSIREPYHYSGLGEVLIDKGEVSPRVLYTISGKGRFEIAGKLTERRSPIATDGLPPDISSLHPPGLTTEWSLSLSHRLSSYLTSDLGYRGEKRPDSEVVHSGQAEMRAYF